MNFEEFYARFLCIAKKFGHYDTPQRRELLKILFNYKEILSAEEIFQKIKNESKIKISLPTVYNLLGFLKELRVVHIFVLPPHKTKKYGLCFENHNHLVCHSCGKIIEFFDIQIEEKQKSILEKNGFLPTDNKIVLYGICKECQEE